MEYSIRITNERILNAMFEIAKENGVNICPCYDKEKTNGWDYFIYDIKNNHVYGSKTNISSFSNLPIDKIIELIEDTNRNRLKLKEGYTAEIIKDKKVVKVGCQEFDFNVIEKLAEMIKK